MSYSAKIVADSITRYTEHRLTTMEVTFPRIVLAEFNTHRVFSRNSASSRAIPVGKQIYKLLEDPFVPVYWGKNQKGMSADEELSPAQQEEATTEWLLARDDAITHANKLLDIGVHKQITNRLLEPWMWQTVIVTATEWSNFFALRTGAAAQPEIRAIALEMQRLYNEWEPRIIDWGDWHLPYITLEDEKLAEEQGLDLRQISSARCARVSYLTHDGIRDLGADVGLFDRLVEPGHMSPLEHPATPANGWNGNFRGWMPYRKFFPNEDDFGKRDQ